MPPPDHRLEPELAAAPPRDLPDEVRHGPWARRQRTKLRALATFGVVGLAFGRTATCAALAESIPPLGWLDLAGGLLLLAAGGLRLWRAVAPPLPLRLYIEGEVLVGRLAELRLVPRATYEGAVTTVAYEGKVELDGPGGTNRLPVLSEELPVSLQPAIGMPLRAGDTVTLLRLPGQIVPTVYGFLDLTEGSSALRRGPAVALRRLGDLLGAGVLLAGLFGALAAFQLYAPLAPPPWLFAAAGAGTLLGMVGTERWGARLRRLQDEEAEERERTRREGGPQDLVPRRPLRPWAFAALVSPLWYLVVLALLMATNGAVDVGPGELRPARVLRLVQTTTSAGPIPLLRELEVEWQAAAGGARERSTQPRARVERLEEDGWAAVEVAPGALGLPWVRAIHPAALEGADLVVDVDGRLVRLPR